jgi:hypothetical protein
LALSLSVRIHKIKVGRYANVFFLFFLLFDERGRRISPMNFIGTVLVSRDMEKLELDFVLIT